MPTDEELESALRYELKQWENMGIAPSQWNPAEGPIGIVVRLDVINDILIDAGILDMDDAQRRYMTKMQERLTAIRKELEPQIKQAKLNAIRQGNLRANGGMS